MNANNEHQNTCIWEILVLILAESYLYVTWKCNSLFQYCVQYCLLVTGHTDSCTVFLYALCILSTYTFTTYCAYNVNMIVYLCTVLYCIVLHLRFPVISGKMFCKKCLQTAVYTFILALSFYKPVRLWACFEY